MVCQYEVEEVASAIVIQQSATTGNVSEQPGRGRKAVSQ